MRIEKSQVARPGERVSAKVAIKAAVRGRGEKGRRVKPLAGLAGDDLAHEGRVDEGADGILGISIIGRVVAELGREGKTRLEGDDGGSRPAGGECIGDAVKIREELSAATKRQLVERVKGGDVANVVGGRAPVGTKMEGIGDEAGRVAGGGSVERVTVVERLGPGVDAAQQQAVAEAVLEVELEGVIGSVADAEPCPRGAETGVGSMCSGGNAVGGIGDCRARERRGARGWRVR